MLTNIKTVFKHISYPILYGICLGILLTLFFNSNHSLKEFLTEIVYTCILTFFFWKGNEFIIRLLIKRYSWIKETRKVILLHFSLAFTYSLLVIFIFYLYLWRIHLHRTGFTGFFESFKFGFYICLTITAISALIAYTYRFFKNWKQSLIDGERLKRDAILLEYESLKNQVNPHFLFNSLNSLTSLIEKRPDEAIHYVKKLSDVFRYVLDRNAQELVTVDSELTFIVSYIYLQKIRFGNGFMVEIDVKSQNFLIVPLALQILIENAIKHNEASDEKPLKIHIFDDEINLIVQNSIQPLVFNPESNHIGLKSLQFQYEYLSERAVEIIHTEKQFTVKLPKLNNNAGINS